MNALTSWERRLAASLALVLAVVVLPRALAQDRQNHVDQKLNLALIAPAETAAKLDAAAVARIIAPFVDDETIVVAHADVSRVSPAPIVAMIKHFLPAADDQLPQFEEAVAGKLAALRRERVTEIYFVVSLGGRSMVPRMSLVLFPAEPKRNLDTLRSTLGIPSYVKLDLANAPSPAGGPLSRPELAEALDAAGDSAIQIALIPPASSRRVIEELMPQLSPQIDGGPSTILTHGIRWAAAAIDFAPKVAVRLTVKSQDTAAAEALRAKWLDTLKFAGQQPPVRDAVPRWDQEVASLTPKLSADRLTVALDEKDPLLNVLLTRATVDIELARDRKKRMEPKYNLRELGLAMMNYVSAYQRLPPPSSHSADGKPLLSWRVAILPFLEQDKLYHEFHLDEPWDSPHNKTLIEKMPAVFHSPKSNAAKGLTNYVVPVGNGAIFSSTSDQPQLEKITDGTSHTIMLVEVDDPEAVIWTKPDDPAFDPQDPKKGVGRLYADGFHAAMADGSVHFVPRTLDSKELKALFTRAGGETLDPETLRVLFPPGKEKKP